MYYKQYQYEIPLVHRTSHYTLGKNQSPALSVKVPERLSFPILVFYCFGEDFVNRVLVDLVKGQVRRNPLPDREAQHRFQQPLEGLRNPLIGHHPLGCLNSSSLILSKKTPFSFFYGPCSALSFLAVAVMFLSQPIKIIF